MLYQPLNTLTNSLNDYLKGKFSLNGQEAAALCSILNQDGTIPEHTLNKIILTLVKLEKNKNIRTRTTIENTTFAATGFTKLYVLVTAVFVPENYDEGLKFLSESINFFEQTPVFNSNNTPGLDAEIEKIIMTPVELNLEDSNYLWNSLGAKYMPSVLYLAEVELY